MFKWLLKSKSTSNEEKCTNCGGGGFTGDWKFGIVGMPCNSCGGSGKKSDQDKRRLSQEAKIA